MDAAAAIGCYGPLIDLSDASGHFEDFVQLLVFVHSSRPYQRQKGSNGRPLQWIDFQMGDDTVTYFSGTVRQKYLGSLIVAGDIILLQNVKIAKYREVIEVATEEISSVLILVRHHELNDSKGTEELTARCQGRTMIKGKLQRVINWIQRTESLHKNIPHFVSHHGFEQNKSTKNWKTHRNKNSVCCISISEVTYITDVCMVNFHACIDDISMQNSMRADKVEKQKHFNINQPFSMADSRAVEDLVCIGCKLCDSPVTPSSSYKPDNGEIPFYCPKSSNHVHVLCAIYKPFMLNVCDHSGQLPILVKNKAAEILFANISAENVFNGWESKKNDQFHELDLSYSTIGGSPRATECLMTTEAASRNQKKQSTDLRKDTIEQRKPDFYGIWLILLQTLLLKDENSPLRFGVSVDPEKDVLGGRFELLSLTMPCQP